MGRRVVIVAPIPEIGQHVPFVSAKSLWRGTAADLAIPRAAYESRQAWVRPTLESAAAELAVQYIDVVDIFCDAVTCPAFSTDGSPLYSDDNHLASSGAALLKPIAEQILADL